MSPNPTNPGHPGAATAPLEREVDALRRRFDAIDAATAAIAAEQDVDRVLQLIADRVRPLVDAQYAALGILGDDGMLERFVTSGIDEETRRRIGPLPHGHGLLGVIVTENRPIRVPDVMADNRRFGFPPAHPPMHSFLGVPVKVEGRSIGNLYLTNKQTAAEFTEEDERVVQTFARHAGIAILNARLHAEVRRMAVFQERERIGLDLHDGVIQGLYAIGLSLEDIGELIDTDPGAVEERVDRAIDAIHGTIRDLRSFIFGLRPEYLEEADLAAGLIALADEFRRSTTIEVDLEVHPQTPELDRERTMQLLQLSREALSNVARHSGATRVILRLEQIGDALRLLIRDNGAGFDPSTRSAAGHHGVPNMYGRAEALGGTLIIESGGDQPGTSVTLNLPLDAQTSEGGAHE